MGSDNSVSETVIQIFELLQLSCKDGTKLEIWKDMANRLSKLAGNKKPWGWRYVASVASKTLEPSRKFVHAVELLTQQLDGTPPEMAEAVKVEIYARHVHPGSLVLGESKQCADPGCLVHFVPVVPWQKYCPRHRKKR